MKRKLHVLAMISALFIVQLFTILTDNQKTCYAVNTKSMKGAWISTIAGDWPTPHTETQPERQKQDFVLQLDHLQQIGINSVFVQVRANADSIYCSKYVPWNKILTGLQGKAPSYDPLAYMIKETHKRGMQFHAWFNPFRANTSLDKKHLASTHVSNQHPEWIVKAKGKMYINPGIPAARLHIIDSIMEVVNNYPIDGVHLDDYFYPPNTTFEDTAAYTQFNELNISNINDWRRHNIDQFVQELSNRIGKNNPNVVFGISPFGVWRNKSVDPAGSDTAALCAYDHMNADVRKWIHKGWMDYVVPQIYWSSDFPKASYRKLVDWWSSVVQGTKVALYIGHAPYKLGTSEVGWHSSQQIIDQLQYNEKHDSVKGSIFFSAKHLQNNVCGIGNRLKNYFLY